MASKNTPPKIAEAGAPTTVMRSFLDLPPELRVQIYSHFIPGNLTEYDEIAPFSLRETCRLTQSEFDHEVEKSMDAYLNRLLFEHCTNPEDEALLSIQPESKLTRHLHINVPFSMLTGTAMHHECPFMLNGRLGFPFEILSVAPHFMTITFDIYRDPGSSKQDG
ncbi:hypothetical protein K491DRAFT_684936 [Lophiostoma macrostomum CBS 122681]|uniref:Uncharacterized protein n=1 Tax=Lophiostoma macrostomum CBS 122681 TaxID=1314788 RepID=A0A6A6SL34_9PLEO|nr:hypothetical protein K491DRAFT_684936 [Lophiostoma macrostomum CBS 122681]